ncbi:MAG: Lipopolysaccharide assembly protein B [Candidatus Marinimicrobia bacterium]|nr:Lipopolysaccharide assembly protein B [Candidatus Neomarinimicrobiota bacterium]
MIRDYKFSSSGLRFILLTALALGINFIMPGDNYSQIRVLQRNSEVAQQKLENQGDIQNKLRQAQVLERQGDLENAAKIYRSLYESYPDNQNVYMHYVDILIRMSDFSRAEGVISRYLQEHPRDVNSLVTLGTVFYNQNDKEQALRQWRSILQSLGKNTRNYQMILGEMVRNGLFEEAYTLANAARATLKRPAFYALQLGSVFSSRLNYKRATQEYLRYYRHKNRNVNFLVSQLSRFPDEEDVHQQVIPVLETALKDQPNDKGLNQVLADYQYRIQAYDKALEHYRKLEEIDGTPGAYRRKVADDFLKDGEYQRAKDLYQTLLSNPDITEKRSKLRFGLAEAAYQDLLNRYSKDSGITMFHRNLLWDLNFVVIPEEAGPMLSEVVANYDSVVNRHQNTREARAAEYRLGEIYFRLGNDFDRALNYFRRCVETPNHPRYAEAHLQIGLSYLAKGDIGRAQKYWNDNLNRVRLQNKHIANTIQLYQSGTELYAGNIDSGMTALNNLHMDVPFSSELFNDILEIQTVIESGLQNKTASDTATLTQFFTGEFYLKQHKITEAQKAYLRVLDLDKDAPIAPYSLLRSAQLGRMLQQREQARNWLTTIIDNYSESAVEDQAMFLLGEMYQEEQNFTEAIHWYEQILINHQGSILAQQARQRIRQLQQQTS